MDTVDHQAHNAIDNQAHERGWQEQERVELGLKAHDVAPEIGKL